MEGRTQDEVERRPMKESEYKYFTVAVLLEGRQEPLCYRVLPDSLENVKSLLTDPDNKHLPGLRFVALTTSDGRRGMFRKNRLQQVHFQWDALALEPPSDDEDEERDSIRIYYRNRGEPVGFEPLDIADIFLFSQDIELSDDEGTSFTHIQDIDGEDVVVNAAAVDLVEIPANCDRAAWERAEEKQREYDAGGREEEEN